MNNILFIRSNTYHFPILKQLSDCKNLNIYIYENDVYEHFKKLGVSNIYNYEEFDSENLDHNYKLKTFKKYSIKHNSINVKDITFDSLNYNILKLQYNVIHKLKKVHSKINLNLIVCFYEKESEIRTLIYSAKKIGIYTLQISHGFGEPVIKPQIGQYKHTIDCDGLAVWSEKVIYNTELARRRNIDYYVTGNLSKLVTNRLNIKSKNILYYTSYTFHDLTILNENLNLLNILNSIITEFPDYKLILKVHQNEYLRYINGGNDISNINRTLKDIFGLNYNRVNYVTSDELNFSDIRIILSRPSSVLYEHIYNNIPKIIIDYDIKNTIGQMYSDEDNIHYANSSTVKTKILKLLNEREITEYSKFSINRPFSDKESSSNISRLIYNLTKNKKFEYMRMKSNKIPIIIPVAKKDIILAKITINSIIYNISNYSYISIIAEDEEVIHELSLQNFKLFSDTRMQVIKINEFKSHYDNAVYYSLTNYQENKILIILPGLVFNKKYDITTANFKNAITALPGNYIGEFCTDLDLNNFDLKRNDKILSRFLYFINTDFFKANEYHEHMITLRKYLYKIKFDSDQILPIVMSVLFRNVIGFINANLEATDKSYTYLVNVCNQENHFNIIDIKLVKDPLISRWAFDNPTYSFDSDMQKSENVVMTTYFTKQDNPQKNYLSIHSNPNSIVNNVEPNDHNIVKPLFDSVRKNNVKLVVFHDELSEDYINYYPNITFIKINKLKTNSIDSRWEIYLQYLYNINIKYAFMVDCFDVTLTKNPFKLFDIFGERLFVGRDIANSIKDLDWNLSRLPRIFEHTTYLDPEKYTSYLLNSPFYNAGLIGGNRQILINTLRFICNIIDKVKCDDFCDMEVLNYTLFRLYSNSFNYRENKSSVLNTKNDLDSQNDIVFTGYPFNSAFKQFEMNSDAYFIHK